MSIILIGVHPRLIFTSQITSKNQMRKIKFVKTVHLQSLPEMIERFSRMSRKNRAVVLIAENSPAGDLDRICQLIEDFPIPVILALRNSAGEKIVAACHLCVAADSAKIGDLSAEEALKRGLINRIARIEEVEKEACALAETIAGLAPLAARACLKAVVEGSRLPLEEGLKLETELFTQIFSTADMREGTRAFLEKRQPNFQGK